MMFSKWCAYKHNVWCWKRRVGCRLENGKICLHDLYSTADVVDDSGVGIVRGKCSQRSGLLLVN